MRHGQPSPKRPRRWRAPLLAVLCTAVLLAIGWRLVDERLAAEAIRQAARGASPAVVALRDDWITAILPTALEETGPVAERARRVATARIDRAVSGATSEDHEAYQQTAEAVLKAIQRMDGVPTAEAVRWAEWVSQRLTAAADRLEPRDRFALFASVDKTLSTLAGRARRESPQATAPDPPVLLAEAPNVEPEPAPPEVEWVAPLPTPIAVAPAVVPVEPKPQPTAASPSEPRTWNPDWVAAEPTAAPIPKPTIASQPKTLVDSDDRDLLARLVRLAARLPQATEAPSAAGPTSAPKPDEDDPHAELRRHLLALRTELAARGFYAVSEDQVQRLLSEDPKVRADLVARLLVDRSGGAARMLLVLAGDQSPAVRAAAISAMGSSTDQQLTRLAWELALQDKSPEVGRLAESLRARLR